MATVKEIYQFIDQKIPFSLQSNFDNSGFLVGREASNVDCILIALDITEEVISEAAESGAQLIVAHHPVIFQPAKNITDSDPVGRRILSLIEHGISAICAHTNLDKIAGGVNDVLAKTVGLQNIEQLHCEGVDGGGIPYGIGRAGVLEAPCSLTEYVQMIKDALGANGIRFADGGVPVYKVAVGGGACGNMLDEAAALCCDTFVTSDIKYDVFLDAKAQGINMIDAGHYPTENVVCSVLADWLSAGFPGIRVLRSERHSEVLRYL